MIIIIIIIKLRETEREKTHYLEYRQLLDFRLL